MTHIALPLTLLLLSTTTHAALRGTDCATRGEKVRESARVSFMKSCLKDASKPENVREIERKHKLALCEQNAKGMKLRGSDKARYEANCLTRNDATIAANARPNNVIHLKRPVSPKDSASKSTSQKSVPGREKDPAAKKKRA